MFFLQFHKTINKYLQKYIFVRTRHKGPEDRKLTTKKSGKLTTEF